MHKSSQIQLDKWGSMLDVHDRQVSYHWLFWEIDRNSSKSYDMVRNRGDNEANYTFLLEINMWLCVRYIYPNPIHKPFFLSSAHLQQLTSENSILCYFSALLCTTPLINTPLYISQSGTSTTKSNLSYENHTQASSNN